MPDKLENHTSDGKGKEKRKSEEEERRRQESNGCTLIRYFKHTFWLKKKELFDGGGLFDGIVFKTAANFILTRI